MSKRKRVRWDSFSRSFVPLKEPKLPDADYPSHLRGYGHSPMTSPRGFKGSKLGPANAGRRLSVAERAAIEAAMKRAGKI